MLATVSPFPQYFDTDGSPLTGGSIYFGSANLNPETNPVTVYWDAAGTQPASQPIATLNGYTVRNGAPAVVYATGDYSITVRNKRGATVFYAASSLTLNVGSQIYSDLANATDPAKGAGLVGFKLNYVSSLGRLLSLKVSDWESIADFYPDGAPTDDQTAWANAWSALTTGKRTLYMPAKTGGYTFTAALTLPPQCGLICSPGVLFTFTSAVSYGLRVRNGCNAFGNGAKLKFTHASWNGYGIYLDGADRFADDYPTFIDGFNVEGNDNTKGTACGLVATNATNFISFVRISNISGYTCNYLLTLNCGSSGVAGDVATWHWINGNVFTNFTAYGTSKGVSLVGTNGVPAECNGNIFRNFMFQTSGTIFYAYGASGNYFDGFIFDWNYASGDAVIMEGGATGNQIKSNIRLEGITGASTNYCESYIGERSGNQSIAGDLDVSGYGVFTGKLECTSFLWVHDTSQIKLGYNGLQSTIQGDTNLVLTPRSGYITQVSSDLNVVGNFKCLPSASVTPVNNGELVVQATSNTTVTIKLKGSDGTVRSVNLTLS